MKTENMLILFPKRSTGVRIIQNLSQYYNLLIIVFSKDDEEYFKRKVESMENVNIVTVKSSIEAFWEEQKDHLIDFLTRTRAVLYFMSTDWLTIQIDQKGEIWTIDHARIENKKFSIMEKILHSLDKEKKIIWINLAYGSHKPDTEGKIFCNTRYGLTGFLRSIELEPEHKNLKIFNICLNYFREQKDKNKPVHCKHCVSEELDTVDLSKTPGGDLVSLVIQSIKRS
ncbi:MAG: hypothetical protein MUO88_13995 [Desulfobacterales bacterium]|nr:hypothetical protein [Desulfobacterales bacterium]